MRTAIRGVFVPNRRARNLERTMALLTVCIPVAGVVVALFLLWGHSVGKPELFSLLVLYCATVVGIGLGYHRLASHHSFQTRPGVEAVLICLGSMAAQGPVLFWAAIHRRHHSHSDRQGDPHSPNYRPAGAEGYWRAAWHAHTGWLFEHQVTSWGTYAQDLLREPLVVRLSRPAYYFGSIFLGLALPALVCGVAAGSWLGALNGLVWGGLVRTFLVHHVTWSINSICHLFGTHAYRSGDYSGNVPWLALLTFGESWHNNHHAFPASAIHGLEWWQIDLSGYIVRTLRALKLAWNVKVPDPRSI